MSPPTTNHQPPTTTPPLVVIVGETASGKTGLALQIAQKFDGEIISADSWAVYKGFDIGTAKPSLAEQEQARVHLIDVAEPADGFNAAAFQKLANGAIQDIYARNKLPMLVGGTGLYIDSVIYDFSFLPPGSADQRKQYNAMSLQELLREVESKGLNMQGIDARNKRRVIRLLENDGAVPARKEIRASTLVLGTRIPEELLQSRITDRVDDMMQKGLEHEVSELAQKYGWDTEAVKGIGYREWHDYFMGSQSIELTRERIIGATMNLAKRQRTWFKRNNSIQWVDNSSQAAQITTAFLNKSD